MIKSILASVTSSVRESLQSNRANSVELPIFPLGAVLFPGGTMALKIFEQRYLEMAKSCLKTSAPFGIALIRDGDEVGTPATPESIGTLAHITDWDMQTLGVLQVRVLGATRFALHSYAPSANGLIVGQVSILPDDAHTDCPELATCAEFLRKVYAQIGITGGTDEPHFDDAAWVGFRLTELLPFGIAVKQKMLELTDARMRLEVLCRFLSDQRLIE